jgi:hypothetical protein
VGIEAEKPEMAFVDNLGSIFLSQNKTSGKRTKHIDLKYHLIREQIKNGLIDVKFVRTSENHADVFTKNLNGEKFNCNVENIEKGVT